MLLLSIQPHLQCDWLFFASNDAAVPSPPVIAADGDSGGATAANLNASASFTDLKDVAAAEKSSAANETESAELSASGSSSLLQNMFASGQRRNSRPLAKEKQRRPVGLTADDIGQPSNLAKIGGFEERNIDDEIARAQLDVAKGGDETTSSSSAVANDEHCSSASPTPGDNSQLSTGGPDEFRNVYEEMRKRRQNNLYSARRNFINSTNTTSAAGGGECPKNGQQSDTAQSTKSSMNRIDSLVRHSRHLNVAGVSARAQSVLSPETQERIRRLQQQVVLFILNHEVCFSRGPTRK